ncbi:hypothetical protein HDV57DRAFT_482342 [Trichoderma longibrachiatum]
MTIITMSGALYRFMSAHIRGSMATLWLCFSLFMGAFYLESNRRQSHCATLREESMPGLLYAAAHRRCCRTPSFCRRHNWFGIPMPGHCGLRAVDRRLLLLHFRLRRRVGQ